MSLNNTKTSNLYAALFLLLALLAAAEALASSVSTATSPSHRAAVPPDALVTQYTAVSVENAAAAPFPLSKKGTEQESEIIDHGDKELRTKKTARRRRGWWRKKKNKTTANVNYGYDTEAVRGPPRFPAAVMLPKGFLVPPSGPSRCHNHLILGVPCRRSTTQS